MNTYIETAYKILFSQFASRKQFEVEDVMKALISKRSSTWLILSTLAKNKKITRLRRGVYTFQNDQRKTNNLFLSLEVKKIIELLQTEGISFCVTGYDILMHFAQHSPERVIHLLYAPAGAGSWIQNTLNRESIISLINPKRNDLENIIEIAQKNMQLLVIRKSASKIGVQNSIASPERAFVDLYFEVTRDFLPFPLTEVAYIINNMHSTSYINTSQMVSYARRRNIQNEIQNILDFLEGKPIKSIPRRATKFIESLRSLRG